MNERERIFKNLLDDFKTHLPLSEKYDATPRERALLQAVASAVYNTRTVVLPAPVLGTEITLKLHGEKP